MIMKIIGVSLSVQWEYIHVYDYNTFKNTYFFLKQILDERLQDHWSSGFILQIVYKRKAAEEIVHKINDNREIRGGCVRRK